jgi:hypothetical protein
MTAVGHFPFTQHFLLRPDPETARLGGMGYSTVIGLYALVLIPSALWMPMTYRMIAHPDPALWVAIRVVLLAVAIGSVGLLWVLFRTTPDHRVAARLAMAGAVAFCFQTAVLDAFIWPAYFPR